MINKILSIIIDQLKLRLKENAKVEGMQTIFFAMNKWKVDHGDYLEFGVYQGRAFIEAWRHSIKIENEDMRFFAFDSFEGLPEVKGIDATYDHFDKGQFSCSEEEFLKNLENEKVDLNRVTTIKGFFNETLTDDLRSNLQIQRVAVAWIDCDLYESTVPVLDFLTPIITTGTFIAFDDWYSFAGDPHAGQIRAVREWLERNRNITLDKYRDMGRTGRIFLVQKWNI